MKKVDYCSKAASAWVDLTGKEREDALDSLEKVATQDKGLRETDRTEVKNFIKSTKGFNWR